MAEKKIKGRKRHIAVDIMGNLLGAVVHAANLHDSKTGYLPALEAMTLARQSKDSARMLAIAAHLWMKFTTALELASKYLNKSSLKNGKSSRNAGGWSAPLPG